MISTTLRFSNGPGIATSKPVLYPTGPFQPGGGTDKPTGIRIGQESEVNLLLMAFLYGRTTIFDFQVLANTSSESAGRPTTTVSLVA